MLEQLITIGLTCFVIVMSRWSFFSQVWKDIKQAVLGEEDTPPLQNRSNNPVPEPTPTFIQSLFIREQKLHPANCVLAPDVNWVVQLSKFVGRVGQQHEVTLSLVGDDRKPFGTLENQIVRESDLNIIVTGAMDILPQIHTVDQKPSMRRITFFATKAGTYQLHCKIMNQIIGNSPLRFDLAPDAFDPTKCTLSGPLFSNQILQYAVETSLTLNVFDQYGNAVNSNQQIRDRLSVLYNNNFDPNNRDFVTTIVPDKAPGQFTIRIVPNTLGIHRIQVYADMTKLLKDDEGLELYVLNRDDIMKLAVNRNSDKQTFTVKSKLTRKEKEKKLEVSFVITPEKVQCVSYVLYFFPKVIWEVDLKHAEVSLVPNDPNSFTIREASYRKKMKQANEKPISECVVSSKERTLILSTIKLMKLKPMTELEMKSTLSHLFTHLNDHDESEKSKLFQLFTANSASFNQFTAFFESYARGHAAIVINKLISNYSSSNSSTNKIQTYKMLVDDLLDFNDQMLKTISTNFPHEALPKLLKKVFADLVNTDIPVDDTNKISAIVFTTEYCNHLLATDGDADTQQLDRVLELFKIISDKDVLQEYYRRHLAKRLILRIENETSLYEEKSTLVKLKVNFGCSFTSKMEGMIRDVQNNFSLSDRYATYLTKKRIQPIIQFKPLILTQGYWPTFPEMKGTFTRPRELDICVNMFEAFYNEQYNGGRKLQWSTSGTIALHARYWSGEYDFVLPTYYGCIMLCFNQQDELSTKQITTILGGTPKNIAIMIQRLVKSKLLQLKEKTTAVNADSLFVVNTDYQSALKKVKFTMDDIQVTLKETKQVNRTIDRDRSFAVEAAIVRIMKSRKTMSYKNLQEETAKQLLVYFTPDVKMIKQKVDSLLSRDYLERDENDSTVLHYLA